MDDQAYEDTFSLEAATALIGVEVTRKNHVAEHSHPIPDDFIGEIVGLITLNDELELLIKFLSGLEQVAKEAFDEEYTVLHAPY